MKNLLSLLIGIFILLVAVAFSFMMYMTVTLIELVKQI